MVCLESTDAEYRGVRCRSPAEFDRRVAPHYQVRASAPAASTARRPPHACGPQGAVWGRRDILPIPRYLADVLRAAADFGDDVLRGFLADTWLADRSTPLADYVARRPELIPAEAGAAVLAALRSLGLEVATPS